MATVCHGEPGTREVNCATVPGCVALCATEAGQWKNCGLKDSEKRSPPEPCSSVSLVPSFSSSSSSFFFFCFLGPHLRHIEVPRIGVKSELELPAYTTATAT